MADVRLRGGRDRGGAYVLARQIGSGPAVRVEPEGVRAGSRYTPGEKWHGYTYDDLTRLLGGQETVIVNLQLPKG